jgi:hypothetical protein
MPKKFITIVSIGPTDITLWVEDKKYDYSADAGVIKHFLHLNRHNQGKAIAYLRDNCNRYWDITDVGGSLDKKAWRNGERELEIDDKIRVKDYYRSDDPDWFALGVGDESPSELLSRDFTVYGIDVDMAYDYGHFANTMGTIYVDDGYVLPYTNWRDIMEIIDE